MKTTITLCCLIFICLFSYGQNDNRKSLHGQFTNEAVLVDNGYVFNLNSKTRTFISNQGFFDVLAKANDTLLVLSPAFKSKKMIIQQKDFIKPLYIVILESQTTALKEVVIKGQTDIKPAIANSQAIVDMKFAADAQSAVKNSAMPSDRSIENGMDFVRIYKMAAKLFKKDNAKTDLNSNIDFSNSVSNALDRNFFTKTLKIKSDEVDLFLDFCEVDPKSKTLLKQEDEFMLIDFLVTKSEEFKRITNFEK
ncbi:hypothetical protein SAMN05444372_109126 [Flavobacterium micromati]|uniref:CarboxypepD_reg-like domain-containing protein n=1 Tax=Flavobacterium micromati TaxID=229205 RepID=A0A1M5MBZ5_9FLAO|nr:hypothetical protein [Flavobacterium micromati]SHG74884.1 hypothetical protein SAMN05444372_109126 [Flavobacterium micromati]